MRRQGVQGVPYLPRASGAGTIDADDINAEKKECCTTKRSICYEGLY